jgi:hypothetical protein
MRFCVNHALLCPNLRKCEHEEASRLPLLLDDILDFIIIAHLFD